MDPRVGTEFAGHRIEQIIGRGGASVVYLAEHLRLGRRVALKVLAPHLADDEGFRERFIRESRTAAALDHPNIVTVYDAGEVDGSLYISMRYVEGRDLRKLLAEERVLEPTRAIAILSQVASALDAAHAEGLVHRDVKPGNILVDVSAGVPGLDRAYLSDFGISKRTTTRGGLTRTGQFVGTVDYVAPEQIAGQPVDGRTDVYSLGCVLYECLRGEVPFPGVTEVATIYSHMHDEPPSLAGDVDSNGGVDDVIARALAKDKADRYDTCSALVEAARSELVAPTRARTVVPAGGAPMTEAMHATAADVSSVDHEPSDDAEIDRRDVETVRQDAPATEPQARLRDSSHRRVGLVSAAAGIIVIAFLAFVLPRLAGDEDPEDVAAGPTATEQRSPSSSADREPSAPESVQLVWAPAYELENVFGGEGKQAILDAVVTEDGVIAVGHARASLDGLGDAAAWRSRNGRNWKVVGEGLADGGDDRMIAVTEFEGKLVAAGWDDERTAVWVSRDSGETWAPSDSSSLGGPGWIRDLVVVGSTVIAVGTSGSLGALDAAAWVSRNGTDWERMAGDLTVFGDQEMWAARSLSSALVAIGYTTEGGDMDPASWIYEDDAWTRVEADQFEEPGEQIAVDLAGGQRGLPLVAVGCDDDSARCDTASATAADAAVWTSDDGLTWERLEAERPLAGTGHQVMRAVVTYRGTFVAVGTRTGPRGDMDGGMWLSPDGVTWRTPGLQAFSTNALGGRDDQSIRALVAYGTPQIALLGFGVTGEGALEDAQVWAAATA
jgi:serine/threonine protein kinase